MPHHTTQHIESGEDLQEAFWTLVDRDVRQMTEEWVNLALTLMATEAAGAAWHERRPERRAWRNG